MRLYLLPALLISMSLTHCANQDAGFKNIVRTHLQRYPNMGVRDLYKLAFQAAMGNEHLGVDSALIHDYLIAELERVQPSQDEPLVEELSPDGRLVRINLRPFKSANGNHQELCRAMIQTANNFEKSPENLEKYWREIEELAEQGAIGFTGKELQDFFAEVRNKAFPAVHHSTSYTETYKPAYRVVLREYLPNHLRDSQG